MTSSNIFWQAALGGAVITAGLFLHGDRGLAEPVAEGTLALLGLACIWSFWTP